MRPSRFVIVGGGLAAAKAAETMRSEGFAGDIVVLSEESERPYERPALSKTFLRGESPQDKLYVHGSKFYSDHQITMLTGRHVRGLCAADSTVQLDDNSELSFDRLLLATGVEPRRLQIPGADLPGVYYLRTMDDALALRTAISFASRVVVIGGGWIGCETAASAHMLGKEVTLLTGRSGPLQSTLGERLSQVYADAHRAQGVRILRSSVDVIEGAGRAQRVGASDGSQIECDVVIVGVGAEPRVGLARDAGLRADSHGIAADHRLETSVPGIFAAGDVSLHDHPRYGPLRSEHWQNARGQGAAAARAMLGSKVAYDATPYFYSDQFDLGMEYAGHGLMSDRLVVRGDPDAGKFMAFWLRDGAVEAGMHVNVWDTIDAVKALISSRAVVDEAALTDPDVPLSTLLPDPVSALLAS